MRLISPLILSAFMLAAAPPALGQTRRSEARKTARVTLPASSPAVAESTPPATVENKEAAAPAEAPPVEQTVRVYLVGGRRLDVDELTESGDAYWFRRGNITTSLDKARVERVERGPETPPPVVSPEEDQRAAKWSLSDASKVESFFTSKFGRALPVTAFGQSDLHTRWGLDHRRSMDVGLHPDSQEGRALIEFLRGEGIPFLTFRRAVPGAATAPHIHIGKPSSGTR